MIITNVNSGEKVSYARSGTTLAIGGQVSIDLAGRQKSIQNVIDVCLDNQLKTIGEGLGAWYVATIIIPAKQYESVPDGDDESGEEQYKEVERPLDMSGVELRLWTLPENYAESTEEETEVEEEEGVTE